MKVQELIKKLQGLDQDLEIYVAEHEYDDEDKIIETRYCEIGYLEAWNTPEDPMHYTLFPGTLVSG